MRKKLLTILLSIFMATTIFTANVFADGFSTVGDIMETVGKFPKEGIFSWKNGNGIKMYLNSSGTFLKFDCYSKSIDDSVDFSDSKYTTTIISTSTLTLKFNIESDVLVSIEVNGAGDPVDGTYTAPSVTIADVLATVPNGFPSWTDSEPANAWVNENGIKLYTSGDKLVSGFDVEGISTKTVKKDNDSDNCMYNNNGQTYEFVMANNVLSRIIVSGYTSVGFDYTSCNGTYEAPKTIDDILPNDFPTETSNAWVNTNSDAYLMIEETTDPHNLSFYLAVAARVDIPITSVVNGNNEYTDGTVTVKFNINNNELESIVLSGHANNDLNGTYVKPYTIEDVLAKSKDPFPSAANKAWVNDDEVGIYKDMYTAHSGSYEVLYITLDGVSGFAFSGSLSEPLKGFNNPYAEFGDGKMIFNISNGVLASIEIVDVDPSANGIYKPKSVTPTPTPTPNPDTKPRYKVPNTGVDVTPTSNHSLSKLSSLSLLAVGTYIVIKKKKDND